MTCVGRFAPTPSGRMHLGNVFAALIAWLSVRSQGGKLLLRMEDLDPQRTSPEYADTLRRDLEWLQLPWDLETPAQSQRQAAYDRAFQRLEEQGLVYPCFCTRSQLHRVDAPHLADGTYLYPSTCRELSPAQRAAFDRAPAWRVRVPDRLWQVEDLAQGHYQENLMEACGDFLIRRADGVYMYQLAVTVDDGDFGVTEVVRGWDLLSSAPRQMYLQKQLGYPHPQYGHIPLLVAPDGRRLSKRDRDLDLGALQQRMTAPQLVGQLAYAAGLIPKREAITPGELAGEFSWAPLRKKTLCIEIPCSSK